jgi:hypothetical protein
VKLFLRVGEPDTARWCSEAIGPREVIRPIESETAGPEDLRDAISVSYQPKEAALVLTSELQLLPNLHGYLTVAGYDVAKVAFPMLPETATAPGFLPRVPDPVPPPTLSPPVSSVPPAPPRMLVIKPLPPSFGTPEQTEATATTPIITTVDTSPTQQLDLFPVRQKRTR